MGAIIVSLEVVCLILTTERTSYLEIDYTVVLIRTNVCQSMNSRSASGLRFIDRQIDKC